MTYAEYYFGEPETPEFEKLTLDELARARSKRVVNIGLFLALWIAAWGYVHFGYLASGLSGHALDGFLPLQLGLGAGAIAVFLGGRSLDARGIVRRFAKVPVMLMVLSFAAVFVASQPDETGAITTANGAGFDGGVVEDAKAEIMLAGVAKN